MGGFTAYTSPSPPASKNESDDGSSSDDADEDEDASSPRMLALPDVLTFCHS